jgi:hypothetical protein
MKPNAFVPTPMGAAARFGLFLVPLFLPIVLLALASSAARAQLPSSVLVVNVGNDVIRAGLSLTHLGVGEMGDQYAVGGTFLSRTKKAPGQVVLHLVTSSGKSLSRTARLQAAPLGNYGFVVLLPKEEGTLKVVNITIH